MHSRSSAYRWLLSRDLLAMDSCTCTRPGGSRLKRQRLRPATPHQSHRRNPSAECILCQRAQFVNTHAPSEGTLRQKALFVRRHSSSEGTVRQKARSVRRHSSSDGTVRPMGTVRQKAHYLRSHCSSEGTLRRKELGILNS